LNWVDSILINGSGSDYWVDLNVYFVFRKRRARNPPQPIVLDLDEGETPKKGNYH